MSEPILPPSQIFSNPASIPVAEGQDPAAVNLTAAPGTLGGVNQTFTLTSTAGTPAVQQVVLTGPGNRVNISGGAADVNALGGGAIIESAPLLDADGKVIPDATKNIKLTAGDDFNGVPINIAETVQGNTPGQQESIADAAGGQLGEVVQADGSVVRGFAFYASGGSGADNIQGSGLSDFVRGGDGDDVVDAGGGNDLVRGGSGSDDITLGEGRDSLYFTLDQIDGSIDTLRDFTSGEDLIALDRSISFEIVNGGQSIIFTTATGQTARLDSANGVIFTDNDIRFLG